MNATRVILIASLFLFPASALPQSVEKEPAAVVELGELSVGMSKTANRASAQALRLKLRQLKSGWNLRQESRRFSPVTRQNGTPTCYSRSLGRSQKKWTL
jgi:hypothetical protein